jgi:hypothetical protein
MTSTLRDICFDCVDSRSVGEFWAQVLGGKLQVNDDGAGCVTTTGSKPMRYWFSPVPETKVAKNRVHIDVDMSDEQELARILGLGATILGEVLDDDGNLMWTVLADVEGNEFCAFPPRP